MAIVKMKKLRVMAMADLREELLKGLLHLGCVQIDEPSEELTEPAWARAFIKGTSNLVETRSELAEVNTALEAIKRYSEAKEGMFAQRPQVTEEALMSAETAEGAKAAYKAVNLQLQNISRLQGEESRLLARQASLQPWVSLDMPLEQESTENVVFRLGVCPAATDTGAVKNELSAADAAAEFYEISADKLLKYCLLICHKADEEKAQEVLRTFSFSVTAFQNTAGTAAENVQMLDKQLEENRQAQEDAKAAIAASAEQRDVLRMYADRLSSETTKDMGAERILTDGTVLFFEGWAPAEKMD